MTIDRIYLGTWLPRTHVHLAEIYEFFRTGSAIGLDEKKLNDLYDELDVKEVTFISNANINSLKFISNEMTVVITEDGVISISSDKVDDITSGAKKVESYYLTSLGPALAYLFSKGAPLPQTLVDIKETYPKIFIGSDISREDAEKIFSSQNDQILSQNSSGNLTVFYGKKTEVINVNEQESNLLLDSFITNLIFINGYADLLRRYLIAHRSVWTEISSIKEARGLHYRDFPMIRNRILNIMKTISFIKTRLQQMNEILIARSATSGD